MAESPKGTLKESAAKNAPTLLKTLGGMAFLVASVGTFVHRIPKRTYVEVHADKPRPAAAKPAKPTPVVAAAPKPKTPAPVAPKSAAGAKPVPGQDQLASAGAGDGALSADPVEDWRDTCSVEIGILCNNVAEKRVPRCLHQYDEVLRKDCLKAVLALTDGPRAADL